MGYKDGDFDEDDYLLEGPTEEQKLEWFNENNIREKDQLISEMEYERSKVRREAESDREHSAAYYAVMDKLFDRLITKTKQTRLFNHLEDWWAYQFSISSDGGIVELQYTGYASFNEKGHQTGAVIDEFFEVIHVPCRLLTVEEYAQLYKVETGTVRQWIRRGKIRTAKKYGNEWRIPELTDVPQRGYKMGQYQWKEELTDVPESYEYMKSPAIATFYQDKEDTKLFHFKLSRKDDFRETTLSLPEREKLELYLIAHPLVKYLPETETYG